MLRRCTAGCQGGRLPWSIEEVQAAEIAPPLWRLLEFECIIRVFEFLGPVAATFLSLVFRAPLRSVHAQAFWRGTCEQFASEAQPLIPMSPDVAAEECDNANMERPANQRHTFTGCWHRTFANEHGQECSRKSRRERLTLALGARGLELRSDSALCAQFIEGGTSAIPAGLAYVVNTMAEMNFYFGETLYASERSALINELLEQAHKDALAAFTTGEEGAVKPEDYLETFDNATISEFAKKRALIGFVRRFALQRDCDEPVVGNAPPALLATAPPTLHQHIAELYAKLATAPQVNGDVAELSMLPSGGDPGELAADRRSRLRTAAQQRRRCFASSLEPHVDSLRRFADGAAPYDVLRFPPSLSREERAWLHEVADELGLYHESEGMGLQRALTVRRRLPVAFWENIADESP